MKEKRFQKIYVEITNICNLQCEFCMPTVRAKKFLKPEEFEIILNKIKPYTNLIYLHIKGEPLLHPNLEEILEICKKYEIQVNITTNATLLYEKLEVITKASMIRQMNLSLHSIKQNKQSNMENYLERVIKAVNIINEKTDILISFRLWNQKNIGENNENIEIIKRLEENYKIENLLERTKNEQAIKLAPRVYLNQDRQFIWPSKEQKIISKTGKCFGFRNQIGILSNGDVVPCCLDQDANIKVGNIFEEDIEQIINKKEVKDIIQGFEAHKLTHQFCQRCDFRTRFGNE